MTQEPEKITSIDAEYLSGKRFAYQEDLSLVEDVDLEAATPGDDINWLEDVNLLSEDGVPAVFDRYSNSFLKIYFDIPSGREDEIARKVLVKHLQSGNSYGIQLKEQHTKFPQPELGPWVAGSRTVGEDWRAPVLEGWEPPLHYVGHARQRARRDRPLELLARVEAGEEVEIARDGVPMTRLAVDPSTASVRRCRRRSRHVSEPEASSTDCAAVHRGVTRSRRRRRALRLRAMAARIVVTRTIPEPALERLREAGEVEVSDADRALEPDELHALVAGAEGVVTMLHDRVDGAFLDAAGPQLRVVANVAVGYDNIDVDAARERGVLVANTPGVLTDATADLAIALLLAVTRRLGEGERLIRSDTGWAWAIDFMLGTSLQGKTLGIVGYGAIGRATAARARAFGMAIAYHQRHEAEDAGDATFMALDDLLATSDAISLHCPLTPQTRHLIDGDALRRMQASAYLVNTARGPIVDEAALVDALADGVIAGAGLDVFEEEPAVHPGLLGLDNVVLVPHLGSATVETRTAMADLAARNVVAVLGGEPPLTPVA